MHRTSVEATDASNHERFESLSSGITYMQLSRRGTSVRKKKPCAPDVHRQRLMEEGVLLGAMRITAVPHAVAISGAQDTSHDLRGAS